MMTHDTPDGDHETRLWCDNCQISVEPVAGESGPECPACGKGL